MIRYGGEAGKSFFRKDGVTQGEILDMILYGLRVLTPSNTHTRVTQMWCSDYTRYGGISPHKGTPGRHYSAGTPTGVIPGNDQYHLGCIQSKCCMGQAIIRREGTDHTERQPVPWEVHQGYRGTGELDEGER